MQEAPLVVPIEVHFKTKGEARRYVLLGVIGIGLEIGKKKRLATRPVAAATWLNGNKDSIQLCQRFRVVQLQYPSFLRSIVLVENAEAKRLLAVWPMLTPRLESACIFDLGFLIEVIGIKDQGLSTRVENATVRLTGFSGAIHIVDFRDVEFASAHQLPDIAIFGQQFVFLVERSVPIMDRLSQFFYLGRQL